MEGQDGEEEDQIQYVEYTSLLECESIVYMQLLA
jgi:hypothetical protein